MIGLRRRPVKPHHLRVRGLAPILVGLIGCGHAARHATEGARLLHDGQPGGALRELAMAERMGAPISRAELADLYVRRAAERGDDPGRYRDLEEAVRLDPPRAAALADPLRAAHRDGAMLHLAAGEGERARELWRLAGEPADGLAAAGASFRAARAGPPPLARSVEPIAGELLARMLADDLRRWLRGETATWPSAPVAALLLREGAELPVWARSTWLRLRGEARGQRPPRDVPAEGRLVAAVEAALAGDDDGDRLAASVPGIDGHLASATIFRLTRRGGAETRALRAALEADRAAVWPILAARGDADFLLAQKGGPPDRGAWARYLEIVAVDAPMSLGQVTSRAVPAAPPACPPDNDVEGFLAFRRALGTPEAEDLARRWVERVASLHCRAPAVVREHWRAGDPAAAAVWAEQLSTELPLDAGAHLLAAEAAVRGRDPARAAVFLQLAEYWGGRRGAASLAVSRQLRGAGFAAEALSAARQALSLGDSDVRWGAYEEIIAAALVLGRDADARTAWDAYQAELPERLRADALLRTRAALAATRAPAWLPRSPAATITGPGDVADALSRARARQDEGDNPGATAVLDEALRHSPGAVELRVLRADLEPPGRPGRRRQEQALLLIGLAHDDERGRAALLAAARLWQEDGRADLAEAARREAEIIFPRTDPP